VKSYMLRVRQCGPTALREERGVSICGDNATHTKERAIWGYFYSIRIVDNIIWSHLAACSSWKISDIAASMDWKEKEKEASVSHESMDTSLGLKMPLASIAS